MKKSIYLHGFGAIAVALLVITLSAPMAVHAQTSKHSEPHGHDSKIQIPEAMRLEHMEIHDGLVSATKTPGQVGEAARKLAAVLDPHFVREEQIALPPLGLLAPLSRGEFTPEMREVLSMTDALRAELPRMLSEHKTIRAATVRLGEVAKAARERGGGTARRNAEGACAERRRGILPGRASRGRCCARPLSDRNQPTLVSISTMLAEFNAPSRSTKDPS